MPAEGRPWPSDDDADDQPVDPEGEVVDAPYLLLATGKALAVDNDSLRGNDYDYGNDNSNMKQHSTPKGRIPRALGIATE